MNRSNYLCLKMISACLNCFAELKLDEYDEYLLTVLDNEKGIYDFKTKQNYPLKKKKKKSCKKQRNKNSNHHHQKEAPTSSLNASV